MRHHAYDTTCQVQYLEGRVGGADDVETVDEGEKFRLCDSMVRDGRRPGSSEGLASTWDGLRNGDGPREGRDIVAGWWRGLGEC